MIAKRKPLKPANNLTVTGDDRSYLVKLNHDTANLLMEVGRLELRKQDVLARVTQVQNDLAARVKAVGVAKGLDETQYTFDLQTMTFKAIQRE